MSAIYHARQKFSDFEVFSEAARNWNVDFRQLDRGRLDAEHMFLGTAETQIMRVRLGRKFHQFGAAPTSGRTIALIDPGSSLPEWCGRRITHDTMPIFAADGSFESVSHPKFQVFTVSVSDDCMNAIAEIHDLQLGLERFGESGMVVNCHRSVLDRLRNRISQAFRLAGDAKTQPVADLIQPILEREVPNLILRAAIDGLETNQKSVRPRRRGRALSGRSGSTGCTAALGC